MKDVQFNPIMLAVDDGYSIDKVSSAYVKAFNKSGVYMIVDFTTRDMTDDEATYLRAQGKELEKIDKRWQWTKTNYKGECSKKWLFVLTPTGTVTFPKHLVASRPKPDSEGLIIEVEGLSE